MLAEVFLAIARRDPSSKLVRESNYAPGGFGNFYFVLVGVTSLSLAADGECCTLWIVTIEFLVRGNRGNVL